MFFAHHVDADYLARPLVSRPFIIYLQPDVGDFERAAPPMYLAPHELIYNAESRAKIECVLQVSESSSSIFFSLSLPLVGGARFSLLFLLFPEENGG